MTGITKSTETKMRLQFYSGLVPYDIQNAMQKV